MYTGLYWFIVVYTGAYWCILVYTGVYWCILVYTGAYWSILVYTGAYWFILVRTGGNGSAVPVALFQGEAVNRIELQVLQSGTAVLKGQQQLCSARTQRRRATTVSPAHCRTPPPGGRADTLRPTATHCDP